MEFTQSHNVAEYHEILISLFFSGFFTGAIFVIGLALLLSIDTKVAEFLTYAAGIFCLWLFGWDVLYNLLGDSPFKDLNELIVSVLSLFESIIFGLAMFFGCRTAGLFAPQRYN